ncbi:ABC transporter permease [Exiguobacterium sp. SH3S2]|uniref:methionine ABC transporter permease n=1 Tax=unclassified Exiguobacterium TaxID=2644629 RepID=UPI001040B7A9|nr:MULTISPECIES: methionine ABC transporter permease [unclassified Exiguobacterium]TCI45776.1 ABC transporter permease [Exiguobacterium sp. SH3S3]TCI50813.1 ABC transporter permease [Exiguobacterium sp. SH5S13]TCI60985.1 ABC transporter permease [Exiguobacterium sp. SH3S2]
MLQFWENWGDLIWTGTIQTLTMTSVALVISTLIGLPLGTLLVLTRPNGRLANRYFYGALSSVINVVRSIPFIILLFFILPFTRFIMGTTIGVQGVLLPLIVFTAPYIARLMESALLEVDRGVVEAYEAMGISTRKIIWYVLIREARSSIVLGLTIATIGLIGATAMAGLVGAGGLGDIAYQYGHLRFEPEVMYVTIFVLILLVQSIQSFGNRLAARLKKA